MKKGYLIATTMILLFGWNQGAGAGERKRSTAGSEKRGQHQERRISSGVKSGELTQHEVKKLNREQKNISKYKEKSLSDGNMTAQEKRRLHKMRKHANRDIYRQKHDRQEQGNRKKEAVDSAANGNLEADSAEQALTTE